MKSITKFASIAFSGILFSAGINANAQTQSVTFTDTGTVLMWTVPCGVDSVIIDMAGAQGGSGGGLGGRVQCVYPTAPGTTFLINVGGQGGDAASAAPGGYNGGGHAGLSHGGSVGSGGGGASDIRIGGFSLSNRVIVAGGGGGINTDNFNLGNGGDTIGGSIPTNGNTCFATFATGGTQTAGGLDAIGSGSCCVFTPTPDGSLGFGGNGADTSTNCINGDGGAGGGGGYYGGGGGGGYGSGAGGSSYTTPTCTSIIHTQGFQSGNGYVTITYNTLLSDSAIVLSTPLCNGNSNGSAFALVNGGTLPYSYSWAPSGGSSDTASGLSAGVYTVTVTDNNGCSVTSGVTLTQPAVLSVDTIINSNVICNGGNNGSIAANVVGGTGSYTYNWSNGATDFTATGLTAGCYSVTVNDANGCTAFSGACITQPTMLVVDTIINSNITCGGGNDGSITANVFGGTGNYTYSWSNGATDVTASGLTAGCYTVAVNDGNGCTAFSSACITQPAPLVVDTAINGTILCNGDNTASITAIPSGGTGAYTYSWNNGATDVSITGLTAGCYTVTVNDAIGCSTTATACITQPALLNSNIITRNIACRGGGNGNLIANPSGGTAPYTYGWSTGATSDTINGLSVGCYTVMVTDANGCLAFASSCITQPATSFTVNTQVTGNPLCNGGNNGSILASPSGGLAPYTYAWSTLPIQTSATANSLVAGPYTVTVTDANGCSATASNTVTQPALLTVNASAANSPVCAGTCTSLTATGGGGTLSYHFAWSTGANASTASVCPVADSTFTITLSDADGCVATASVTVNVNALPTVTLHAASDSECVTATSDGLTGSPVGGTYSGTGVSGNNFNAHAAGAGTHKLFYSFTDNNGCTNTDSVLVIVNTCTGVNEVSVLDNEIKFYPNPFSQSVNIDVSIDGPVAITMFNMLGENVGTWQMDKGLNTINTSAIPSGVYTMQVKTTNGLLNKKLVKVN